MRKLIFISLLFSFTFTAGAQVKYFVYFRDKVDVEFNPYTYFDQKAIERRIREGLSLYDFSDYPVTENYIQTVGAICDSIQIVSRWMNGISIYASPEQISRIEMLPFVKEIERLRLVPTEALAMSNVSDPEFKLDPEQIDLLKFQTFRHNASAFAGRQLSGNGIRIAIFDVGFPNVDTHDAFKYLRDHHRIIATYDFIKNNADVYYSMSHGTMVLSCIAGWYDTIPVGMAPDAEFLLAKTELRRSEFSSEEDNWLAAAEWADKNGADIISSSLGYGKERYYQNEMDGKKSLVSRAAKIASDKGILVINAAGNEADNVWETIVTPADVEEVLTVGGISANTDMHIDFSSFGPTADGRMKPNVCSLGDVICAEKKDYGSAQGTSFATPLIAGFAACAWQSNRELTRAELFDAIEKSSHLYPYYDYAHGYGVPQAGYFTGDTMDIADTTFTISIDDYEITVQFPDTFYEEKYQRRNFYYEFIDEHGSIIYFAVSLPFFMTDFSEADIFSSLSIDLTNTIIIPDEVIGNKSRYSLRAHFEGYTETFKLISLDR